MRTGSTAGLVAAGFALTALVYGLARFAYGLLLPQIKAELSLSTIAAGWIGSAAFAAYCIGIVVAFLAVPRCGARAVAILAGLCATAGLALAGLAVSATTLGGAIALAGSARGLPRRRSRLPWADMFRQPHGRARTARSMRERLRELSCRVLLRWPL